VTRAEWQAGSCGGDARTLGGFLRVREIDAGDCAAYPDAFAQLRAGALQAVVVHAVYPPAVVQEVVARLERHDPAFLQTWFPEKFRSWFYGRNVNLSAPGLPGYFAEAAAFHAQLDALFPAPGLVSRVAGLLAALDGGRPFQAAPGPRAPERYMFTTLRAHLEGGYIPPHVDNEQALRPSFAHLRTLVEPHMMSFVLAITRAGAGGALEVFDFSVAPEQARLMSDDRAARPGTAGLASVAFRLPAGSLIVLDSGRLLHRLTPVEGPAKRWTACSFFALARDRSANYCWG
jgi:hypothetical protein